MNELAKPYISGHYSPFPPHLIYYTASPAGHITRAEVIADAGPSLMHDFAITTEHVLFFDLPVVFNPAEQSGIPYRWSDSYQPRIGVLPRTGPAVVQWFEVEPSALLHSANAYVDEAGRIVLDGPRYDRTSWESTWKWWVGAPGYCPVPGVGMTGYRWVLDPATGKATEEMTDDLVTEFPTIDNRLVGLPNRHSYALAFPGSGRSDWAVVKYDHKTGQRRVAELGSDRLPGEPYFVPADGGTRRRPRLPAQRGQRPGVRLLRTAHPGRRRPGHRRGGRAAPPGAGRHPRLLDPRLRPAELTMITDIDQNAAVVVRRAIRIGAPIDRVWQLHTDVDGWPAWQSDIDTASADGPLLPGMTFQWSTAGMRIASTVYAVDAPHRILWGGPAHGITGIHEWTLAADGDATVVHTAESWDGEPVRADTDNLRAALDDSLASWLEQLRKAAENTNPH